MSHNNNNYNISYHMVTKKDQINYHLASANKGVFGGCSLTTNQENIFSEYKSLLGLDSSNQTSSETIKYGSGAAKFEGDEWYDGGVFAGESSNNRYIIRFTGSNGQRELLKLVAATDLVNTKDVTITQFEFYVVAPSADNIRTMPEFQAEAFKATSATNQPKAPSVNVDRDCLRIGSSNATRSVSISPVLPKKSTLFDKIKAKITLKDLAALEIVFMLKANTDIQDAFGFVLFGTFKLLGQSPLINLYRSYLQDNFNLGLVIKPKNIKKKSVTNPLLKYAKGACSALVKKLKTEALSLETQSLIASELLGEAFKNKNEIKDYDKFVILCNNALQGKAFLGDNKGKEDPSEK